MSASETLTCSANITDAALTAWHDGFLTGDAHTALVAHMPSCRACQLRLADLARIDALVGVERAPLVGDRLWRGIQREIAQRPASKLTGGWLRASWRSAAVALSALLIVASFVGVLKVVGQGHAAVTASPTPPAAQFAWHESALPVEVTQAHHVEQLAVALSDGNTAYLCATTSPGQPYGPPQLWVTHDRAAHWAQAQTLSETLRADEHYVNCQPAVDVNNPSALALTLFTGLTKPSVMTRTLTSADAGVTWNEVTVLPNVEITQLASTGSTVYGAMSSAVDPLHPMLWRSTDHLRSWRQMATPSSCKAQGCVQNFWVDAQSGSMLLQVGSNVYLSSNGGESWGTIKTGGFEFFWARIIQPGKGWYLCGAILPQSSYEQFASSCSSDEGETWRPNPSFSLHAPPTPMMVGDGSLLGVLDSMPNMSSGEVKWTMYRLHPGSGQWQPIGDAPSPVLYASGPGNGMLWAIHRVGDSPLRIFTADYVP